MALRKRKTTTNGNERTCSNCGKAAKIATALTATHCGRLVVVLCDGCQHAKKIRVTLTKGKEGWEFEQYYPVEA